MSEIVFFSSSLFPDLTSFPSLSVTPYQWSYTRVVSRGGGGCDVRSLCCTILAGLRARLAREEPPPTRGIKIRIYPKYKSLRVYFNVIRFWRRKYFFLHFSTSPPNNSRGSNPSANRSHAHTNTRGENYRLGGYM